MNRPVRLNWEENGNSKLLALSNEREERNEHNDTATTEMI